MRYFIKQSTHYHTGIFVRLFSQGLILPTRAHFRVTNTANNLSNNLW